jgi:replicative DNA helicase
MTNIATRYAAPSMPTREVFTTEAELQAEEDLIGICLRWPQRIREIDLSPEHFVDLRWAYVFRGILALDRDGLPVSEVAVFDAASREPGRSSPVPLDVLFAASNRVATGTNVAHHASLVRGAYVRRSIALACSEAIEAARSFEPADELLGEVLRKMAALNVEQPADSEQIYNLLKARFVEISTLADARARGESVVTGVPTGIAAVDDLVGGFQRGVVTIGAGRPGMGKSAFALACVRHASAQRVGCHIFSLEDTRAAYCDRVIAGESNVAAESLRTLELSAEQRGRVGHALGSFRKDTPWLVEDRSGISADEIVRSVRRKSRENKTQLVVVDYIQLLRPPRDVRRGEEAITHAMNVLADAAKQDGIAYLVLAQLNRECEKRDNKRPQLSDLRGAGAIEERAKAVFFLYRPAVYGELDRRCNQPIGDDVMEILIAKNNQGRTGKALATWDGRTMRIS